uniref:Uncharacterized protein n=1 Tax=Panagrolaimus sp. JU765 TaxID=591449 RepID=A0AC34Q8J2_9BILA
MELPKMWLIQLVLMFCCFYVSSSLTCEGYNGTCSGHCYEEFDYSFAYRVGAGCWTTSPIPTIGRDKSYSYCSTDGCNNKYNVKDQRGKIKCYGNDSKIVENCDMCISSTINTGCRHKNAPSSGGQNATHGHWFRCYGELCNTNEKKKWRKCYVGEYGDCSWTYEHKESSGLAEKECDQWHAQNICVQQIWTHKTNKARGVCHKFRCYHQLMNHGYELVYKQFPNLNDTSEMTDEIQDANVTVKQCVTKGNQNCFKIEPPPKIKCYVSNNASLGDLKECNFFVTRCRLTRSKSGNAVTSRNGCSPANILFDSEEVYCYDTTGDTQTCDILVFFHKPKETYCHGWDKYCYKAVLNGTCTWYDCDLFDNRRFSQKDNIQYNYTRPDNNAIVFPVDHHRCAGENCNTPKDSANDLGSNLALMLLAIGLLNVLE